MKRGLRIVALTLLITLLSSHALAFEPLPYEMAPAPYAPHAESFLPDNAGYHDDSLDIRIETFRRDDTTVMAVYVTLTDPSQLRTGCAAVGKPHNKLSATADTIAKKYNAVLAINGDFYIEQDEGRKPPRGIIIRNRELIREVYATDRDTLIIDQNGDFTIIPTTEEAFEAFEGEIIHSFWFGPGLVVNGERISDEALEKNAMNIGKNKPVQRMAIGQLGPLSYLILACEGPESKDPSMGFTLEQIANLCLEMGCINAYNLDGGSSTSVILNYQKINSPSNRKKRAVGDIIYFATLVP